MLVDKRKLIWLTYQQEKVQLKELIGRKQAIILQEINTEEHAQYQARKCWLMNAY